MPPFRQLAPAARLYVSLVSLAGLALIPLTWALHPIHLSQLPEFAYLAVGAQIAALMPVRSRGVHSVLPPMLVAVALLTPGAGVALVAWLCLFDSRLPGRDLPWWAFFFNRAMIAISYSLPSLVVAYLSLPGPVALAVKTAALAVTEVAFNYALMAAAVVLVRGQTFREALTRNTAITTVWSTVLLAFTGGVLFAVLSVPGGYLLAPAFFGFLLAIRANIAYAHQQSEERLQTLQLAAQALDARDPYTERHSERVARLATRLGEILAISGRELEQLATAASLHDIGKIGIRDNILNKSGPLTKDEWAIMKQHPEIGAEMIAQHSALSRLAPAVRHHHERWDGTGYPEGLVGDAIPMAARIISVADGFDTITSVRSYRPTTLEPAEAVENITALSGKWYDANVVDALRELYGLPRLEPQQNPEPAPFHPIGAIKLLRSRARFARLVTAATVSNIGDPLTMVAVLVVTYSVTRQALFVAAVFSLQAISMLVVSAIAGALTDKLDRRRLIVTVELFRAGVLVLTPFALAKSSLVIFPVVVLLAGASALAQPARQATIPELVEHGEVGPANAVVAGLGMLAAAIAYPLAGLLLWLLGSVRILFWIDAATFVAAAALITGLGPLGGGVAKVKVTAGLRRAWAIRPARMYLLLAAASVFFISMCFPVLIVLAYKLWPEAGATGYTVLQAALALGVVVGSFLVGRLRNIGRLSVAATGLALMGVFSLGVAVSPNLAIAALLLFVASIGNPIYVISNQTALLELGESSNRGSLMTSRFGIAQSFLVAGTASSGVLARMLGPTVTYLVIGTGLLALAAVTLLCARLALPHVSRRSATTIPDRQARAAS